MSQVTDVSHSFSSEIAQKYGVECAIMINHFSYWLTYNARLGRNFLEGTTWMYQTQVELANHFPYWSPDTVYRIIAKLKKAGVIRVGKFNKTKYDHTQWYTFKNTEEFPIPRNRGMISAQERNEVRGDAEPIPVIEPVIETNTPKGDMSRTAPQPRQPDPVFSFDKQEFEGIEAKDLSSWKELYPAVDVQMELKRMREWVISNEKKSRSKTKWRRFINNWLKSSNDAAINKQAYHQGRKSAENQDSENENRVLAQAYAKKYISSRGKIEAYSAYVEIDNGTSHPFCLKYCEKGFREQLESEMRKYGFSENPVKKVRYLSNGTCVEE